MQILDALDRFIVQLTADGRSSHTIGQYRRHVRLFARWAREVGLCGDVAAIGHEDVAGFLASTVAQTCADGRPRRATSANCLRSSLRGFFGYLERAGHIGRDPARLVRRAQCASAPPRVLSPEEERRLFATLEADGGKGAVRDLVLFRLLRETGVRLSSALALRRDDIDLERCELEVRSTKGDRPARLPFPERLRPTLEAFLQSQKSCSIFVGRGGGALTPRHVQRRLSQWCEQAGIRAISPHAFRHTFATRLYERTGDVLLVKEALRHRSIASTLVYATVEAAAIRTAIA